MRVPHLSLSYHRKARRRLRFFVEATALSAPYSRGAAVLIDAVTTREGITGRADVFAYTTMALPALHRIAGDIGAELVGMPSPPQEVMRVSPAFRANRMAGPCRHGRVGHRHGSMGCIGAGRSAAVVRLLGGTVRPLDAYEPAIDLIDPNNDANVITTSVHPVQGHQDQGGDGDMSLAIWPTVHSARIIGPDMRLMVVGPGAEHAEAVRRVRRLTSLTLHWFKPVKAEAWLAVRQVRAATSNDQVQREHRSTVWRAAISQRIDDADLMKWADRHQLVLGQDLR